MVGNVTIQGQIVGTATFDGAKISAVVTIAPPINATVVFGRSGVTIHNQLTGRDAEDAHPIESITDLPETLQAITNSIPTPLGFTPENAANKKTTLTNSETDYPSTSAVNRLTELKQTDSPEFADTQITTLQSDANGGIVTDMEATWIGATAKSVLSYLQKLVSQVFSIDGRVSAIENNGVNIGVNLATTGDYVSQFNYVSFSTQLWAANFLHASPFIPSVSFNSRTALIEVTNAIAGAKAKIIIWSTSNGVAFTKLYEGAELDLSVTGNIIDSSIDFNFDKKLVYYVGLHNSSAVTLRAMSLGVSKIIKNDGTAAGGSYKNYISAVLPYGSAIPTTFPAFTFGFTNLPIIRFKISSLL